METFLAIVVAAVLVPLVLLGSVLVYALIGFTLPLIIDRHGFTSVRCSPSQAKNF